MLANIKFICTRFRTGRKAGQIELGRDGPLEEDSQICSVEVDLPQECG